MRAERKCSKYKEEFLCSNERKKKQYFDYLIVIRNKLVNEKTKILQPMTELFLKTGAYISTLLSCFLLGLSLRLN